MIAGTAGNSGTQALAVAVRGIATRDIEDESKFKLLLREAGTGLMTGFVCAVFVVGLSLYLEARVSTRTSRWRGYFRFYFRCNNFGFIHPTVHAQNES